MTPPGNELGDWKHGRDRVVLENGAVARAGLGDWSVHRPHVVVGMQQGVSLLTQGPIEKLLIE